MVSTKRTVSLAALVLLAQMLGPHRGVGASSPPDSIHFCASDEYEQWRRDHPGPAAKRPANLNLGEPRTVRMIYFLPNDWPYRAEVVDSMKTVIRQAQNFYAEQMQAHGYGNWTFRIETDAQGEPMVHRVDGKHPFSHYDNTLGTAVVAELEETFDLDANIYFIVLGTDALRQGNGQPAGGVGGRRTKNGGNLVVPDRFGLYIVSHELGHTFGLSHDFRDDRYIMSYGGQIRVLSACAAEFLAVHAYFNPAVPTEEGQPPNLSFTSPQRYQPGATSVPVRLQVSDSDGVHQVALFVRGFANLEVVACRSVRGRKDAVVEFEYNGAIPSNDAAGLSDFPAHTFFVEALDLHGNEQFEEYTLAEISASNIATWKGHTEWVSSVSFSPDGTMLASGSQDDTVKLWDASTLAQIATFEERSWVGLVSFSPDGTILAINFGGSGKLRDVATGRNVATFERASTMAFSPDGATLAVGIQDCVELWDVATKKRIATLKGHTIPPDPVSFSPDGTLLASGSHDNTVRLWDVATRRNIAIFEVEDFGVWSVVFSPDGEILAVGTIRAVELWDVATSERIDVIEEYGGVNSVVYSPGGRIMASAAYDKTVKLWDAATRRNLAIFPHSAVVNSVSFSSDRRTLASGAQDGTIALWDIAPYITPQFAAADFDRDGTVGFQDFLQFAAQFGTSQGDAGYDARFDLDGDGAVGFSDLLIFAERFGK